MIPTRLLKWQIGLLSLGTAFSWSVLLFQYARFLGAGCGVLQLSACAARNPVLTPCFYGAWAFLAALVWALFVTRCEPGARHTLQRRLNGLLVFGTLFAWGNFGYELYRYVTTRTAPAFSCPAPGGEAVNPFTAPCFSGALIFLCALLVSLALLQRTTAGTTGGSRSQPR